MLSGRATDIYMLVKSDSGAVSTVDISSWTINQWQKYSIGTQLGIHLILK